ncbi:hypothetical protein, conserved [Leishmania tarentolae]|uniref:Uncharacterized protein n=1 Tax=Leishmania tarentolae TaxID=5689 RepID=A0A640KBX0_LEITA|nr:hypothetical protein, conserved [Leishmania tarentolae]
MTPAPQIVLSARPSRLFIFSCATVTSVLLRFLLCCVSEDVVYGRRANDTEAVPQGVPQLGWNGTHLQLPGPLRTEPRYCVPQHNLQHCPSVQVVAIDCPSLRHRLGIPAGGEDRLQLERCPLRYWYGVVCLFTAHSAPELWKPLAGVGEHLLGYGEWLQLPS